MKLDTNSIPKLYNQQQSIAYSRYFDFLCIRQLLNSEQYEDVENEESEYENSRFGINMEDVEERIKEHIEETAKQFRSNIGEKWYENFTIDLNRFVDTTVSNLNDTIDQRINDLRVNVQVNLESKAAEIVLRLNQLDDNIHKRYIMFCVSKNFLGWVIKMIL